MATTKRKHAKPEFTEVVIPDKLYFRIGEVSELAALPTYVLRFWETEFSQLKPTKSSTGQRMYRRKDVESVLQIRKLLYEDGFTIAGAREKLREEMRQSRAQQKVAALEVMEAREELAKPTPAAAPPVAVAREVIAAAAMEAQVEAAIPPAVVEETSASVKAEGDGQPMLPFFMAAQQSAPTATASAVPVPQEQLRSVRHQLSELLTRLS